MRTNPPSLAPFRRPSSRSAAFALLLAGLGSSLACIDDPTLEPARESRFELPAPPLRAEAPSENRNVFWGDLHIHSSYSYDAYTMGTRALPDDAYRYCKGETIQHALGYPIRAGRALDFAAVTDHAEYLGVPRYKASLSGDPDASPLGHVLRSGNRLRTTLNFLMTLYGSMDSPESREASFGGAEFEDVSRAAWREIVAAAQRHNEPGRFTTFIAYEWTSMPESQNLHRNVIYRGDRAPEYPFTSLDSENPEDLWDALDAQRESGLESIAIPHNANVSNGLMYAGTKFDGSPMTADYATQRMRLEPVSEIFQIKGQSEIHPVLSVDDEFANFSIYDKVMSTENQPSQPQGSYARDALRQGLELAANRNFNPYRFGVIGASDSHNASSSVEEDNHHGKLPMMDGTAGLRLGKAMLLPESASPGRYWGSAGLAGVWARENTREALFEAMQRKETYATSGPRIEVRFFGGWDFDAAILDAPDLLERAYAQGIPMGGDLSAPPTAKAPRFIVVASMDPIGAHLDRIQIIKGWVDANGSSAEKIYDVVASDRRIPDPETHRVAPLASTVDAIHARYANSTGASSLKTVWTDPDFDPTQQAFYYARVIEIATPTYTTYDAHGLGVDPPSPAEHQERAVTSAIWIRPALAPERPNEKRS